MGTEEACDEDAPRSREWKTRTYDLLCIVRLDTSRHGWLNLSQRARISPTMARPICHMGSAPARTKRVLVMLAFEQ